jgi:hypothetical protein
MRLSRRGFLQMGLGAPLAAAVGCGDEAPDDGFGRGDLRHLLPTASRRVFNIKASFERPRTAPPLLSIGDRSVQGARQDTSGRFFAFRAGGLEPGTEYKLQLHEPSGAPICDAWPLATLPAQDARPERMRIAAYTCAGGPSLSVLPSLFHAFKPAAYRQALFDAMLAQRPQLVVANGDHVYYDLVRIGEMQRNALYEMAAGLLLGFSGDFDRGAPILGGENERVLTAVGDDQIAGIYGVRFRSTPVFFITDDHDYFENDDATPEHVTFPPDAFHRALRDTLQDLYFPEFIVEREPDDALPGIFAADDVILSRAFGEIDYGDLFSGLFYDCGGHLGLGPDRGLVPPGVESWLLQRTADEDTAHLVHFPSHPMGWTAGKWREWYPDFLENDGAVVAAVQRDEGGGKYLWQAGWWDQHQRLLRALSSQRRRSALMVSGDLHALGAARIERSGDLDLSAHPVHTVLSGPVGVGDLGWPSRARGVVTRTPADLEVTELLAYQERNGFSVLDLDRTGCDVTIHGCPEGYVGPRALQPTPALHFRLERPTRAADPARA